MLLSVHNTVHVLLLMQSAALDLHYIGVAVHFYM